MVQGLTEFLPVSSSAHLVLFPYFFQWKDPGLAFDVALHMGTLAAIFIYFRKEWMALFRQLVGKKLKTDPETPRWYLIVLGTIPAGIAGLLLEKHAEHTFRSPLLIAATLVIFGLLLGLADVKGRKKKTLNHIGWKEALYVGCAQALAIIPGVSRSGITITTALILGFTRLAGMRFSFLLSAPIIAGAGLMKLKSLVALFSGDAAMAQAVTAGFLSSLVSGILALVLLNALAKTRTLLPFMYYRLALGLFIVVFVIFR